MKSYGANIIIKDNFVLNYLEPHQRFPGLLLKLFTLK